MGSVCAFESYYVQCINDTLGVCPGRHTPLCLFDRVPPLFSPFLTFPPSACLVIVGKQQSEKTLYLKEEARSQHYKRKWTSKD